MIRYLIWVALNIIVIFVLYPAIGVNPGLVETLFTCFGVGFWVNVDRIQ